MNDKEAKAYIVIVVIGVIVIIAASTYMMRMYSRYFQCVNSTTIWCSDNWKCEVDTDPSQEFNSCFLTATDDTGLASCLYGPDSVQATKCYNGVCECPNNLDGTANCYSGCPIGLSDVSGSTACCCTEGSECTPC